MSPGQSIDKHILSSSDLMTHSNEIADWNATQVMLELMNKGFDEGKLSKPEHDDDCDSVVDLLCFGSKEVTNRFKIHI